ncbi:Protein of unknown function [Catalinimonas alkaloidigena]|uniref:DUF2911 domain-containing protein n=1 Tax=Catalinimonas alkaloidigena TaxID=1075417 RepID=A0A1G9RIQ5_9BACT|nr:DUF2911 domain-containing protein [Catalinimonas alkaloidigena]SDM23051.1 Protein of unknown function [Catalinimonas alkaloidigena]
MKKVVSSFSLLLCLTFLTTSCWGQDRPSPAKTASGKVGDATITIDYSSPAVKGRTVWGDLVPYNDVWRTGANEATVIKFDKDVTVEGKKLSAGEYALFTIPTADRWTVIFNDEAKQWGAFNYNAEKDVLRVEVSPKKARDFAEQMEFVIESDGNQAGTIYLTWENMMIPIKIKVG